MSLRNLFSFNYWLDPAYLQTPASPRMWLLAVLGGMGIGLAFALRKRLGAPATLALASAAVLVAISALARLWMLPILGLRLMWLVAAALAALPFALQLIVQLKHSGLISICLQRMAFIPTPQKTWRVSLALAWLGLHLLGLLTVVSINRWSLWLAPLFLLFALSPAIPFYKLDIARYHLSLNTLSPLLILYATVVIRISIRLIAWLSTGASVVPEPLSTIFNPTLALLVTLGYSFVLGVWQHTTDNATNTRFLKLGASVLVVLTLAWSVWLAATLRTHGVSGSDPYAYAQMGVDLAQHGTVFHSFPLMRLTYALNIPSEPVVHLGYKLPQDISRMSTTVWSPGYAVFIAAAYLLGGETGVYWLAPVLSVLSLLVIVWLVVVVLQHSSFAPATAPIAALTVFFVATSYQQMEWQLIPMADIGSQLFSLMALAFALSAQRQTLSVALAGACIGIAFDIRYTQVLIAPAIALAIWFRHAAPAPRRLGHIALCALCAALAAAPILLYHARAFGSPFLTGSDELQHFSLAGIPQTLRYILNELLWSREFGFLLPFMLVGIVIFIKHDKKTALVLAGYFLSVFCFHLLYAYLRQRDLLAIFPIAYFFASVGIAHTVSWLWQRARARSNTRPAPLIALITLICFTSFSVLQRSIETLILPITKGYRSFGYLVKEQRAAFDQLAQLTPTNALVASSLNSGAIDLHAQRLSFRPVGWNADQLMRFTQTVLDENTPLFVLDDGKELADTLATLRKNYTLIEIAQLDVPYYFPNSGGSENRSVPLFQITRRQ